MDVLLILNRQWSCRSTPVPLVMVWWSLVHWYAYLEKEIKRNIIPLSHSILYNLTAFLCVVRWSLLVRAWKYKVKVLCMFCEEIITSLFTVEKVRCIYLEPRVYWKPPLYSTNVGVRHVYTQPPQTRLQSVFPVQRDHTWENQSND